MARRDDILEQNAADALAALGNRTRLRVFKLLVRAGREGTNIGTLQTAPRNTPRPRWLIISRR